jgi:nucleoside-diphosphate-sugar epimerase
MSTLLVTGATGLAGSHVAEAAIAAGFQVCALVRPQSRGNPMLERMGVREVIADLADGPAVAAAVRDARWIVHCAAQVGDWGPAAAFHRVNVEALEGLLAAARAAPDLRRFIAISSLGVYQPRDHFGTDETEPPWAAGLDAYTRSKAAAEGLVTAAGLPAVILRPGFIYGPRDRHVLPGLLAALKRGRFTYIGDGRQRLNHVYAKNLAAAVLAALAAPGAVGEAFNITDAPVVSRVEFVEEVATLAGYPVPKRHVPRPVGKMVAFAVDRVARTLGAKEPPLLSKARYKFLALNLEFSIAKAERILGYRPAFPVAEGLRESLAWFRAERRL